MVVAVSNVLVIMIGLADVPWLFMVPSMMKPVLASNLMVTPAEIVRVLPEATESKPPVTVYGLPHVLKVRSLVMF